MPLEMFVFNNLYYRVILFLTTQFRSSIKSFQTNQDIEVFCLVLCEVCGIATCLSFECEVSGLLVLYSQTKVLKLRKVHKTHSPLDDCLAIGINDTKFMIMQWKVLFIKILLLPYIL